MRDVTQIRGRDAFEPPAVAPEENRAGNRWLGRVVAMCLLLALAAAPGMLATTAIYHTEASLADEAALVVTGTCLGLESQWLERDLVTLARISVTEVLKGTAGSEITVVLPGGIDMARPVPVAVTYPAAPGIAPGESVLLFLIGEDRVANGYGVVGFSQGKFTLVESPKGAVATQNLSGLRLVGPSGNVVGAGGRTLAIEEVRQLVKRTAAERRRGENNR
jgi:hypothetical protein